MQCYRDSMDMFHSTNCHIISRDIFIGHHKLVSLCLFVANWLDVCVSEIWYHTNFWNENGRFLYKWDHHTLCARSHIPNKLGLSLYIVFVQQDSMHFTIVECVLMFHLFRWSFKYLIIPPISVLRQELFWPVKKVGQIRPECIPEQNPGGV